MKKLYITFCLLLVSLCIHAQMISGIIVNKKKQPLEFANIVLFSLPDFYFFYKVLSVIKPELLI